MGNGADPYGKSKSVVKFRVSRGQEHEHEYRLPGWYSGISKPCQSRNKKDSKYVSLSLSILSFFTIIILSILGFAVIVL
jgi:hypothetical protein